VGEGRVYFENGVYVVRAAFMKIKAVGVSTPCPLVVNRRFKRRPSLS